MSNIAGSSRSPASHPEPNTDYRYLADQAAVEPPAAQGHTAAELRAANSLESLVPQNLELPQLRIPDTLEEPFHTGQLAEAMSIPRWRAQQIAYCLRKSQALTECGKRVNARLYQRAA